MVSVRLLLCLALLAPMARGDELLVVGAHFERVFERNKHGEYTGMGPEILRAVAGRMGHTVRFALMPWPRAQAMVAQGQADILVGPYKSEERMAVMAYSAQPFYRDQMVFYAKWGSLSHWDGKLASLGGMRILAVAGWFYGEEFNARQAQLKPHMVQELELALNMLAVDRADLLATNRRNTEPVVRRLGLDSRVAALPQVISTQDGYFAFPLQWRRRAEFDAAFDAFVRAGELKKLGQRLNVNTP